jgi:hypothetical protein
MIPLTPVEDGFRLLYEVNSWALLPFLEGVALEGADPPLPVHFVPPVVKGAYVPTAAFEYGSISFASNKLCSDCNCDADPLEIEFDKLNVRPPPALLLKTALVKGPAPRSAPVRDRFLTVATEVRCDWDLNTLLEACDGGALMPPLGLFNDSGPPYEFIGIAVDPVVPVFKAEALFG